MCHCRSVVVLTMVLFPMAFGNLPSPSARHSQAEARAAERGKKPSRETTAIANVRDEWATDLHAKRLEPLAMLFAPDAVFLAPTGERIAGRQAIRELCRKIMDTFTSDITLHSVVLQYSGNLAYDSGEYRETLVSVTGGTKSEVQGNYLMVFKRQEDRQWLIVEQVWTEASTSGHGHSLALGVAAHSGIAPRMAQLPRVPDLEAQRAAMKKLGFLIGKWVGEARVLRGPGEPVELNQTEEAQYKLDGLILQIEGVGRTKSGGRPALQALGLISYDDESRTYHMRAFNDGRFLETEVKLVDEGKVIKWGFALGEIRTNAVLRMNEKGEWTELHEITIGVQPPRKLMELTVRPQK